MQGSIKLAVLAALVAGGWSLGYRLGGKSSGMDGPPAPSRDPAQQDERSSAKSEPALAVAASRKPRAPSSSGASGASVSPGGFDAIVAERGLAQVNQDFRQAFSRTEAGTELAKLCTLLNFDPQGRNRESGFAGASLRWLKSHPSEAFEEIQRGLPKLEERYGYQRQYLIQFASRLEVAERNKIDWLASELRRPMSGERGYDGAAALSALIEVSRDPVELEELVKGALEAQPDARVREMLLSVYSAQAPERVQRTESRSKSD
jgi:hypothetical protein